MTAEEINLKLGITTDAMRQGTLKMLDEQKKAAMDYVEFWTRAAKKREAEELAIEKDKQQKLTLLEKAGHDARVAAYKEAEERRQRIGRQNYENTVRQREQHQQNMKEIAAGSGGYGSLPAASGGQRADIKSATTSAAATAASGGGAEGAIKGFGYTYAFIKIAKYIDKVFEGEWTKGMKGVSSAMKKLSGAFEGAASVVARSAGWLAVAYYTAKTVKEGTAAGAARQQEVFSNADLAFQTGSFGGRAQDVIDRLEKGGFVSGNQAERLRGLTNSGNSDQLRAAQRFLIFAQEKESAALAEKKAKAERDAAGAADYAKRAAEGKAIAEAEAEKKLREQTNLSSQLTRLTDRAAQIRVTGGKIDQESVTIADLAGRDYVAGLNQDYGAGGRFDLGAGDGPFAQAARGYLLAQKQQQWDITHGNAIFDDNGVLVGGAAYEDKQRQIKFHNLLKGAGMDTPAMQFAEMRDSLNEIQKDIASLYATAAKNGIVIKGTE